MEFKHYSFSNATNQMEIRHNQTDINDDVVMPGDKGQTVGEIFTYKLFYKRSIRRCYFAFNDTAYLYFGRSETTFNFLVDIISNNTFSCLDLIETSDKRLKEEVEDVDEDCSELVKNIKAN